MKRQNIKKRPLSDATISSLLPENTLYREKDSLNLYLQVKPTGAKSWVMRYKKPDGKWSWHGLGACPLVTGATARKRYHDKIAQLASGKPLADNTPIPTFFDVAMDWYNAPPYKNLPITPNLSYCNACKFTYSPNSAKRPSPL